MGQIEPVVAVLGVLLCCLLSIVLFVYRSVRSLPAIEKASKQQLAQAYRAVAQVD
mgnify:CR=1 FL=1